VALQAEPVAEAEPDAEAAAVEAIATSDSVASAAQRSESASQAAPTRSRRSSRVTVNFLPAYGSRQSCTGLCGGGVSPARNLILYPCVSPHLSSLRRKHAVL